MWNVLRYIFLEYASPNHALEAVKNADGYKLDKQHTFRVNLFTDFDKYVLSGVMTVLLWSAKNKPIFYSTNIEVQ